MSTLLRTWALGFALALLAACQTPPPAHEIKDEPLRAVRRAGYFVVVRYLDEATLKARYGARYNAFITFPRAITPTSFMVFKLNLEEVKQPLFLQLNKMEIHFGDKHATPTDLYNMNQYWAFEDPDTGIQAADQNERDRILREEMLAYEQSVPAGARVSKLVVFRANFPRSGEAKLIIPLFDPKRELVEKLEFVFTF